MPGRFVAQDAGADGRIRIVDLTEERVVMRRSVRGIPMAVSLPVTAYRGIVMKPASGAAAASILLAHRDEGLSLELAALADEFEAVRQWRAWSQALSLPLLSLDADGQVCEADRPATVRFAVPVNRRRRRNAIRNRRPSILMRRKPGLLRAGVVHRNEREIIARN